MIILCDIDDTISNFGHEVLKRQNAQNGTNYTFDQITTWDWMKETFKSPWSVLDTYDFWDKVEINKNAIDCLENLVNQGHQVYLVTASHYMPTLSYKVHRTLSSFNPKLINEDNVIICRNKQLLKGDIIIDDAPHNLNRYAHNILIDRPWNRDCDVYFPYRRCKSWIEVDRVINYIINKE